MESRQVVNSFEKLLKSRQEMRQDQTRDQLRMIEANQRAAFLVRMFEQGQVWQVRKVAAAG